MKVVKIEILPAKDNETVSAVVIEQSKDGGEWKESSKSTVMSGTPEATRTILLDDNERLVIEGTVDYEIVYDPKQMAAVRVPISKEAKEKEAEVQKRLAESEKKQKEAEEKAKKEEEHKSESSTPRSEVPPIDSKTVKEEHSGARSVPKGR